MESDTTHSDRTHRDRTHSDETGASPMDLGETAFPLPTRVLFGANRIDELGAVATELGAHNVLIVTMPGLRDAGHVDRALGALEAAGRRVSIFDETHENPTTDDVERCARFARETEADCLVGLGGGSAIDTAKGCNFLLSGDGRMQDYHGYGKAGGDMLPLIAIPTTAGTGSECQSYTIIADADTHMKMACGDPRAMAAVTVLDPTLTLSLPREVTATAGIDALAHAVETATTRKRIETSWMYSQNAFRKLVHALPRVLNRPDDIEARGEMLLGAAYAGTAIELSMLGAAHSAANPLTAEFGVTHGTAVGLMLPHVVRFNGVDECAEGAYDELMGLAELEVPAGSTATEALAGKIDEILALAGLARTLDDCGIDPAAIPELAEEAAMQWTAQFNPREVTQADFEALYRAATVKEAQT